MDKHDIRNMKKLAEQNQKMLKKAEKQALKAQDSDYWHFKANNQSSDVCTRSTINQDDYDATLKPKTYESLINHSI